MQARRHGPTAARGLRAVAVVVAAAWLLAGAPVAQAADGGAAVTIDSPGQPPVQQDVSAADIEAMRDVPVADYTQTCPPDSEDDCTREGYGGLSAASLAASVGVTPQNVERLDVRTTLGSAFATGDEVRDGFLDDPAPSGAPHPALFRKRNAGLVSFLRPYRRASNDYQDLNPSNGETLAVRITTVNGIVGVAVSAPATAEPQVPVELSARTTGTSGRITSVSWAFGDGKGADTASVRHTYQAKGNFIARATIQTADGRSGVGQATIAVGATRSAPTDNPPATAQPDGPRPGGDGAGGTGNADATASGPATSSGETPGATPTATESSPTAPGGTGKAPRNPSPTTPGPRAAIDEGRSRRSTSDDPVPSTPATPTTLAPGRPRTSTGTTSRSAGRTKDRRVGRSADTDDGSISGVLVASRTATLTPASQATTQAAAARKGTRPRDTSDAAWIIGPLAFIVLLGAGAARELRPRSRTHPMTRLPVS